MGRYGRASVRHAIGRDVGPRLEELAFPYIRVIDFGFEANGREELDAESSAIKKLYVDDVEAVLGVNRYRLDSFPTYLFGAINSV